MSKETHYQNRFDSHKCCILIPTYNNHSTLQRVVYETLVYTTNVIIINDGSTDGTEAILEGFSGVEVINLPENKGKGNALKVGFKKAEALGYHYAITMDSDGQHFPDDLSVFLEALDERMPGDQELLLIGSRKMDDPSVPDKSTVGNRLSTFWYWVETGIELTDTQCGYRLYPLRCVNSLRLQTTRFELEIEVIVKAAWEGVNVINRPVKVLYDPTERVTHFRPFQDVARITLLNIWFVAMALFYVAPRNVLRSFRKEKIAMESEFPETGVVKEEP